MMPVPSIRIATVGDLDSLLGLMEKLIIEDYEEARRFDRKKARKAMRDLLLSDGTLGLVLLAEDKKDAAGYLVLAFGYSLEFHGRDAFLDEFFVEKDYRGRGLGRKMFARAESSVKKLGIKALHLEVTETTAGPSSSTARRGFRTTTGT